MMYMLCNPEHVDGLNRSLMRLHRPAALRNGYVTDFYAEKVTHPVTGYTALVMPETERVRVHEEATGVELQSLLSVFVSDEAITQSEADVCMAKVAALASDVNADGERQSRVNIIEFVPPSWLPYVLTKEQMEADEWIEDSYDDDRSDEEFDDVYFKR